MEQCNAPLSSVQHEKGFFNRLKSAFLYEPAYGENPPAYLFFKNRYFRAFFYFMMCLANTLVYYGWQHFSRMLFRAGAYRWQCDASQLVDRDSYCDAQYNSVQVLFQVGLSSEFIIGVLAGISLDYLGPWITACIGCSSYLAGWVCLIYSSQSMQLYILAMILLAGAVNLIAFPALCLGDMFPSKSGLIISLVVAAQTTGTVVAPVMKVVWDAYPWLSYEYIVWHYLLIAFFPLTFVYLLSVPFSRNVAKTKDGSIIKFNATNSTEKLLKSDDSPETAVCVSDVLKDDQIEDQNQIIDSSKPDMMASTCFASFCSKGLVKQLTSIEYIVFSIYYILQLLQFGYYPTTVEAEFGNDVSDFQGYMLPTQGVFGALFGLAVDYTKSLPICLSLVGMMSVAYVTALIRNKGVQYFTSVLYVISNSYIYTVKYTYVAEMYPPKNFGVLIGLIGCVSGVFALLNIPIQSANNYFATCIAYSLVGLVAAAAVLYLYWRKRKGIHYKDAV